ncbi:dienelactone hydrolase family protein [Phenylobacterium aquaticum]|uniref:dienelactone hydrolase family protein n=1 Tax=Phenylobacterium aquaticum TaxID=1763816 RepID=UPI001F5D2D60|nr:dienelactone hydrolase family protein [Phenylobacterium aquaticum]MCI3133021.1 dienelactone hydrolase family protein [Phenylobacterium aquaticum]
MTGIEVRYAAEDIEFVGTLFLPSGSGPAPGVLVAHESPGITQHTLDAAQRLAALGFVALATDYQGGGQVVTDRDETMRRYVRFMADPAHIQARLGSALQALKAQPRVDATRLAAIGFCYGGTGVLELARKGAELRAVVGFHSGLGTARPEDSSRIKAKVLVHIGCDDPVIPLDQRNAFEADMTAGGVDWRMTVYGRTGHSFTNPEADSWGMPGFAYQADSNARAWRATEDLLRETGLI